MGASARKKARREAGEVYSKPAKVPTTRYQSVREAQEGRRRYRAAERAVWEAVTPLVRNMRALAGIFDRRPF